jgi:hypothetical protein
VRPSWTFRFPDASADWFIFDASMRELDPVYRRRHGKNPDAEIAAQAWSAEGSDPNPGQRTNPI